MKENLVKQKLSAGKPVYGVIAPNTDPVIAETIGHLGFDYYMMDGEHGTIGPKEALEMVRACEVTGITPLARIRSIDAKLILQYMDAGVIGVMMPGIKTVEDVKEMVAAIKYPPLGKRGMGPVRAADYLLGDKSQQEYIQWANEQTLVLPQIEDLECVENLEAMTGIEGVDGFIVGPRDLAMSMGFYDGPQHEEVKQKIDEIFTVVLDAGLVVGTVAGTRAQADALIGKGARIILHSVSGLLKQSAARFLGHEQKN